MMAHMTHHMGPPRDIIVLSDNPVSGGQPASTKASLALDMLGTVSRWA